MVTEVARLKQDGSVFAVSPAMDSYAHIQQIKIIYAYPCQRFKRIFLKLTLIYSFTESLKQTMSFSLE